MCRNNVEPQASEMASDIPATIPVTRMNAGELHREQNDAHGQDPAGPEVAVPYHGVTWGIAAPSPNLVPGLHPPTDDVLQCRHG